MSLVKKIAKWTVGAYAAAYIGLTVHAFSDAIGHKKWLDENMESCLFVSEEDVVVDDSPRKITVFGETHTYNQVESDAVKDLVKDFDLILFEGTNIRRDDRSLADRLYMIALAIPAKVSFFYMSLAQGRYLSNTTLVEAAEEHDVPVVRLEKDSDYFDHMSSGTKALLFVGLTYSALKGPLRYYDQKEEILENPNFMADVRHDHPLAGGLLGIRGRRDYCMVKRALPHIQKNPEARILLGGGLLHVKGFQENLARIHEYRPDIQCD